MKTSRWKRYDPKSGLWIESSKSVFGYWFRFLNHAENHPDFEVDWSLYEEWGGRDYILHIKQNDWWKAKWKTLFGYEEGETEPLYPLSKGPKGNSRPKPDAIKFALMVYELKDQYLRDGNENEVDGFKGDKWEIAKYIAKWEYPKRRDRGKIDPSFDPEDWVFNIARKSIANTMVKEDLEEFRKQKRTLQSRVGRYMSKADDHLENVCRGQFP